MIRDESPQSLAASLISGDRRALAQAITLVESNRTDHQKQAQALLGLLIDERSDSIRIGVSGAPGVGKSTFIEALGCHLVGENRKVAILAVDPSSKISGGSILGDKVRMEELSKHPDVFIRPSPSSGVLGGVAPKTDEVIILLEAAGFDTVIVETVGVGQSETSVADMTDIFLLLLHPGGGDELQGIKRGSMELADILLVNKADGDMERVAAKTVSEYRHATSLLHNDSPVVVDSCSAIENLGIDASWEAIKACYEKKGGKKRAVKESGQGMIEKVNHIAIAVPDILSAAAFYKETLGLSNVSEPVLQPEHGVTTVFIKLPNITIELITPYGEDSPIDKFMADHKAGGIHHVCYEVDDIKETAAKLVDEGLRILGDGVPKIGAHGKPVLFLHPKDMFGVLTELEEA